MLFHVFTNTLSVSFFIALSAVAAAQSVGQEEMRTKSAGMSGQAENVTTEEQKDQLILHDLGRAQAIYKTVARQSESEVSKADAAWRELCRRLSAFRKSGMPEKQTESTATMPATGPIHPVGNGSKRVPAARPETHQEPVERNARKAVLNGGVKPQTVPEPAAAAAAPFDDDELSRIRAENERLREELRAAHEKIAMLERQILPHRISSQRRIPELFHRSK